MSDNINEIKILASAAINIISSVFNGNNIPSFSDDFDWKSFVKFCSKHKILNLVSFGLKNYGGNIPEIVSARLNESLLHSMAKEAQRDVEIELLSESFENNKIPHMILKGYIIKDIYPQPYLRSMGDVDILVGDNLDKASEVITQLGFDFISSEFLHSTFIKNKTFAVELHKSLIDESIDKYYSYFCTGFERAELCEGCEYKYQYSIEDFYIFLIAHMAKHYEISGTGIRSVCDIYVFNEHYKDSIDSKYIDTELEKIGLLKFNKKITEMSREWFGGNFNGSFDSVGEYIISGGVYGKFENHELNAFLINGSESKKKYLIRNIFPEFNYMKERYSILNKIPILLPLFWIIRIFSTLFKSKKSIRYRLKGVADSSENDSDRFTETGLK